MRTSLPGRQRQAAIFQKMARRPLISVIIALLLALPAAAQLRDLQVKALFLEAAVRFITWPADSAGGARHRAIVIGIFGNDKAVPHLTRAFSAASPGGAPARFLRLESLDAIDSCDIVCIPANKTAMLGKILDACRGKPVLTVSDFPDFASKGVILVIAVENQRIRCYINETAAVDARIGISHHLLRKSTIIAPRERRP